jgi:hypothetical protein
MRFTPKLALAVALSLGFPAAAHEGGVDARGVVAEVSAARIVLETPEGQKKSFVVTPATEVRRGKTPAKISDVVAGEKAVVHGKKTKGEPEANSVRVSARKAEAR